MYEVDITMRWLAEDDKNNVPIQLEFCLSGHGDPSRTCKLGLFIDLPASDTPQRVCLTCPCF